MTAPQDDLALVRRWFQRLQLHVQTVDFVGARPLFADDMITFGSFNPLTIGRNATEEEQWRTVWGRIDRFRWRLDELHTIVSEDRLTAIGIALFDSMGYTEVGAAYERPGRATIVLGRDAVGDDWVAQHMHISLFQDVPARSFGSRPEHVPVI
jgi:ketosteroid isomerase-like protein